MKLSYTQGLTKKKKVWRPQRLQTTCFCARGPPSICDPGTEFFSLSYQWKSDGVAPVIATWYAIPTSGPRYIAAYGDFDATKIASEAIADGIHAFTAALNSSSNASAPNCATMSHFSCRLTCIITAQAMCTQKLSARTFIRV